ncbi:MAG: hypothetical protein KY476_13470 [Planctomycetes bacterium]|nr:hypothetical protein [Planctomycetota bacterium]
MHHCRERKTLRAGLTLAAAMLLACGSAPRAAAQVVRGWHGHGWGVDAVTARIHAQADLIRAVGTAAKNVAEAREIRARAYRAEIANEVYRVEAYWKRKSIAEAELMARQFDRAKHERRSNFKAWERLKNFPELNGPGIENGSALNFLLHRLSATFLAVKFDNPGDDKNRQAIADQLRLSPEMLHNLRLRQHRTGGQHHIFRADEGIALAVDWWPYALREDEFAAHRRRFHRARERVSAEAAAGDISNEAIREFDQALADMKEAFDRSYSRRNRHSDRHGSRMNTWQHYRTASLFLSSLSGEILRLQTTGSTQAFDGSLKFTGHDLVELITYMSRNGLDFAPAQPGEEHSYHDAFAMLRDVYTTVADDDEGAAPPEDGSRR